MPRVPTGCSGCSMAPGLRRMGYVLRYPDLPLSEHCKSILLPGGHRGLGCTPGVPGATHRDTWLTFGSPCRRPRPRAPGCTPLGGALGSSQGVFPVLLALPCQPFFSPRGDASPSVLGTRPPSVAHLFCTPSFQRVHLGSRHAVHASEVSLSATPPMHIMHAPGFRILFSFGTCTWGRRGASCSSYAPLHS